MKRLIGNKVFGLPLLTALLITGGCNLLNPDRELITGTGSSIGLVEDNPTVRSLISVQKYRDLKINQFWLSKHSNEEKVKRVEDEMKNPEPYMPGRRDFLAAMARQPGFDIPENTYARLLKSSGAKCLPNPIYTTAYIKIRITTGPYRGHEGWVCEEGISRTVVWP